MKLDIENNSLVLTMAELATLGKQLAATSSKLSLIPSIESDDKDAILTEFGKLGTAEQDTFSKAITMLATPEQVIQVNYSISDSRFAHVVLAFPHDGKDTLAMLTITGESLSVSLQPPEKIELILSSVLAVNAPLFSANTGITLSAIATITLIAIMDYYRYATYHSLLTHTAPVESFILSELMERIEDADCEDFRWPLLMLEKIFPAKIADGFTKTNILAALEELCDKGLLSKNEAEDNRSELNLYSLKEISETIKDSLLHDISKVALRASSDSGDGSIGHEVMLLVRDSNYLWLFGIAGNEGIVASIDSIQFGELLKKVLSPPENKVPVVATEKPKAKTTECCAYHPDREPVAACVSCGKLICADCKSLLGGKMYCAPCADALFLPKDKKKKS